jgi:hypothetical protein
VATWQNLVDGALRSIGQLASGDSPSTQENTDALVTLNAFIGHLSAKLGPIHMETTESLTWASGSASRTIGSSGDLNTGRPQKILAAYSRASNIDTVIEIITHRQYQDIPDKTTTSTLPLYLAYNPTTASSRGTLFMYPVPSASVTLVLTSLKPLDTVGALSETVTLPPGYEAMVRHNLALWFSSEYGALPNPMLVDLARRTMTEILHRNIVQGQQPMRNDPLVPGQGSTYNGRAGFNI